MIDIDTIFPKHFYSCLTGTIQEFTIVRYDDVSSFPSILEIVFEPLDTGEIDKVGWFIKKKKIRSRKEYLGKSNLGSLSSRYLSEWSLQKMKNPYSTRDSLHIVLVRISSDKLVPLYGLRISDIFACFSHIYFFLFNGLFEFSYFREGITELISNCLGFIHKMDLFEIPKSDSSDILNTSIVFANLT